MRVERRACMDRLFGRRCRNHGSAAASSVWSAIALSHHCCAGRIGSKVVRSPAVAGMDHTADHPPSTDSVARVMFAASSLARNTTAVATSESVLARRDGTRASSAARWSANCALRSVMLGAGRHGVDPHAARAVLVSPRFGERMDRRLGGAV
jgi:hypothetical protein